jgi:hypothetical protein
MSGRAASLKNVGGDIFHRAIHDFMDEADILVFAGRHARNYFAFRKLGIHHSLAAAPPVVDHHDEILHARYPASNAASISENRKLVKLKIQ